MISCRYGSHLRPPPSLAPPAPPPLRSVRHVWQRILSPSLQLSGGVRQVTAGVPASPRLCPSLSRSMRCVIVCVVNVFLGGWGVGGRKGVSVLALLTSRRSTLPAPSMSAHTPLPCRLDLTAGGDDGENLGSRRGVDPEESERQREADTSPEAYLQPTGRSSDSPSWYGSLKSFCRGSFGDGGKEDFFLWDERCMISFGGGISLYYDFYWIIKCFSKKVVLWCFSCGWCNCRLLSFKKTTKGFTLVQRILSVVHLFKKENSYRMWINSLKNECGCKKMHHFGLKCHKYMLLSMYSKIWSKCLFLIIIAVTYVIIMSIRGITLLHMV